MVGILCALCISNNCLGVITEETAWRDAKGDMWDVCIECVKLERKRNTERHGNG